MLNNQRQIHCQRQLSPSGQCILLEAFFDEVTKINTIPPQKKQILKMPPQGTFQYNVKHTTEKIDLEKKVKELLITNELLQNDNHILREQVLVLQDNLKHIYSLYTEGLKLLGEGEEYLTTISLLFSKKQRKKNVHNKRLFTYISRQMKQSKQLNTIQSRATNSQKPLKLILHLNLPSFLDVLLYRSNIEWLVSNLIIQRTSRKEDVNNSCLKWRYLHNILCLEYIFMTQSGLIQLVYPISCCIKMSTQLICLVVDALKMGFVKVIALNIIFLPIYSMCVYTIRSTAEVKPSKIKEIHSEKAIKNQISRLRTEHTKLNKKRIVHFFTDVRNSPEKNLEINSDSKLYNKKHQIQKPKKWYDKLKIWRRGNKELSEEEKQTS